MRRGIIVSAFALSALTWIASGSVTAQRGAASPATGAAASVDPRSLTADLPFAMPPVALPQIPSRTVRITDHGARGDGVTLNTDAIAAADRRLRQGRRRPRRRAPRRLPDRAHRAEEPHRAAPRARRAAAVQPEIRALPAGAHVVRGARERAGHVADLGARRRGHRDHRRGRSSTAPARPGGRSRRRR